MDDERRRPTVLTVMAEHVAGDPVWDRPHGDGDQVDLSALGVSAPLVARLRAWDRYARLAVTRFLWEDGPGEEAAWERDGLELAHALQDELYDVEVRYWHGGNPSRGVREHG